MDTPLAELAQRLSDATRAKVGEIQLVTQRLGILALNARIQAAKSGTAGLGFTVIADEMRSLSVAIDRIATDLPADVESRAIALAQASSHLSEESRGQHLGDLALNLIEIIDRNLYERSCDVRWWATDAAVVAACDGSSPAARSLVSERLGVILGAYTVYRDIWIISPNGEVIANGRPVDYPSAVGRSVTGEAWFTRALATASGDAYVAVDPSRCPAIADRLVATYATAVRSAGAADGGIIGVIAVFFDWQDQSRTTIAGVRFSAEERACSRALLLNAEHLILAASDGHGVLTDHFPLDVSAGTRGCYRRDGLTVAYSLTPGYETYAGLGWYGVITQVDPPAERDPPGRSA